MSTSLSLPSDESHRPGRLAHRLAHHRLLVGVGVVALVVVSVVLAVTDSFAATSRSGNDNTDSSYVISIATLASHPLSSQTEVNATVGHSGSYPVSVQGGVAPATLIAGRASVQADEKNVSAKERALSSVEARVGNTFDLPVAFASQPQPNKMELANASLSPPVHGHCTKRARARVDLARCDLAGADLVGADLAGADLAGADLAGADLAGTVLSEADLRGANLASANLSHATLEGANLARATLTGAKLVGTSLMETTLVGVVSGSVTGT
ncbi:MAG: pentapeptide repeat-containing protein, partial [Acidimicrobiales bacterium]